MKLPRISEKGQEHVFYAVAILFLFLIMVAVSGIRAALVPEAKAIRTFESSGYYTNVQITHKAWFAVGLRGCGQDDSVRFDAITTNPSGQQVDNVYVCASWLKGGTLRTR